MNRIPVLCLVGLFTGGGIAADDPTRPLTPLAERVSDRNVTADAATLDNAQQRLFKLNERGVESVSYHYAKAQAWLDFARAEYQENDRERTESQALREALYLIDEMEDSNPDIVMQTSLIPNSERLREDLWIQAELWKQHAGFRCAEPEIAEFEVQLVRVGHEKGELGWRHARRNIQAAERLARQIPPLLENCQQSRETRTPIIAQACDCDAPVDGEILPRSIFFGFNKATLTDKNRRKLDHVAKVMREHPQITVQLSGHADQVDDEVYNDQLSRLRADAAREYLIAGGVSSARINVQAMGESNPAAPGCTEIGLAQSRRVEFTYYGATNAEIRADDFGIQIEPVPSQLCER